MSSLETWMLIGAVVALPGLIGYVIGGLLSRLPANDNDIHSDEQ